MHQMLPITGLVVIDAAVEDGERLAAGLKPGAVALRLEANQDGIAQISRALQRYRNVAGGVAELHLIAHGAPGCLFLGDRPSASPRCPTILLPWRHGFRKPSIQSPAPAPPLPPCCSTAATSRRAMRAQNSCTSYKP